MSKPPLVKLSELLLTLNPYEFSTFAFILGVVLSNGLNSNQLNSIGNFYELLGQTILTIQSQVQLHASTEPSQTPDITGAVELLKNKIGNIEQIIADFQNL